MIRLVNEISRIYPERSDKVVPLYMNTPDVINLEEIKTKVERLLLQYRNDDIDIFFSPGTSIMQLSWYICHTTLGLNTRLLQTRPARFSKDKGRIELMEITVDRSSVPVSAIIKEDLADKKVLSDKNILVTESIQPVYDKAFKIAQAEGITTLIYGESGTGKENLAKYIHDHSSRKGSSFITVNCSAMGESLLESRLFGHKKGAFTGADKDALGLFEEADGGTILLDEIGDISSYMQQSLLRVIQNKEIQPIGGKSKKVDVRIISATNKDLKRLCSEEKFRWDLYYRLSVTDLELPSLRELGQDEKKEMIKHFIKLKQKQLRRPDKIVLRPQTLSAILAYPFPGNIREMENLIESLYVFNEKDVDIGDLPKKLKLVEPLFSFKWQDAEKLHIEKVLKHFKGNKRQACKALGYGSQNTLMKKVKEYEIEEEV
jgi:transcriptional regulator with PAS, ATPase and Fis domain